MSLVWKPTQRQEDFISLPDEIFEALYGGQAGGGKSEVLLQLPLARGFHQHSKFKGIILRRTLPELEREIIIRSQTDGFYEGCGARYQDQKKRWIFPSGAIIQFGHLEHEKDVKIYDTAQYNYIGWDEVTSFTPYQYEYLTFSRCRTSDANLPTIVRSGTNPGGVSHNYFRKRFVEPCREGNKIIVESKIINERTVTSKLIFIKSRATDNDYLMKADPGYLDRMYKLPEAERIAKADGDWWIYAGQVFSDFREKHLASEPSNALHVIEPFEIPSFWPRVLSVDWGYAAMMHALWTAINPLPSEKYPAKLYHYREYGIKKTKISEWAKTLKVLSHGENIVDRVIDPSAFGHRGDEKTIAEQAAEHYGKEFRRADNDRISGKLLIQEYLKWKEVPRSIPTGEYNFEVAQRIRRISGDLGVEEYKKLFLVSDDPGYLPKLQIFNTCPILTDTIPLCNYDKTNVEDVAEFDGDDPYDNWRYNLKACQAFLSSGSSLAAQEAERQKVIEKLEETHNMTAFYMNMNRIEFKESRSKLPVRYRSRRVRCA